MKRSFFRKVGFGIGPHEDVPDDPLQWAKSQLQDVPELSWPHQIPTGEALLTKYAHFVYQDRKVLRETHRRDRRAYEAAKDRLRVEVGEKFHENLELAIRHHAALHSNAPVFERLWWFWCNHFAITDKDFMPEFTTGPYHRETIRQHMTGSFHDLLREATLGWSMIHNLDNSESVGPNSQRGKWRRKNGKVATVNENHARELLELHSVSPASGYSQKDVLALSYIMAGWEHKWTKKRLECNPVHFEQESHEPGNHKVLGKAYKQRGISPKTKLLDVLEDLASHPATIDHISYKLCRHFICDSPTDEMMAPIKQAWRDTGGDLPAIHSALMDVVWEYAGREQKFQNPEVWLVQMVHMSGAKWIEPEYFNEFDFSAEPHSLIRQMQKYLKELGHNPYRPDQPNGFPDSKADWLSPELLIRRFTFANRFSQGIHQPDVFDVGDMIAKNFDNPEEMHDLIKDVKSTKSQNKHMQIIFPSLGMLHA